MMNSNLNLAKLPECVCEMRYIDSALLTPCAEYQRVLRTRKVEEISATFSEYVANEPRVSYRDGRYHVFDGQNTIEARIACNGGHDLPILCKVFHGLSKKDEALLFAVQTGISTDLTAGERLRADIVAEDEDACAFVAATEATGATFALDGIRAEWKIYCIRSAYYIYKNYGSDIYQEALKIIVEAWWGDSDSFLSGILHGVTRFVAMYRDEYSRERLIARLSTVHPKTITKNARKDTGNTADRHMKQILEIYNGSSQKKLMGGSWQKSLDKKSSKYAPSLLALRGTDFVICNDHGFPINPDSYGALVRRIGQRAGIEGLHPHMFRHTFVSILLSNPEIGVATVAAEAGHAQPSTTLAIYTQVYDKRRKEIRNQMSKELYE